MSYRDHEPIVLEEFNGLWKRGDVEHCPLDHFSDCDNIITFPGGFRTRDGIDFLQIGDAEEGNITNAVRIYTYVKEDNQSLLVLDTLGNLYHTGSPTPLTPILSIPEMTDFAFVAVAGRAYISPHDGNLGLEDEFLYVYLGEGDPARKAAGAGPTTAPTLALGATLDAHVETGYHVFGVVYETDTGFLTQIGPVAIIQATGAHMIDISNIPVSPDSFVVARHIVASKAIDPVLYTGNPDEYELYFVPDGRIDDNATTSLNNVNFFDSELLDSASNLEDLFSEIPAGVFLTTYHGRLIIGGIFGVPDDNPDLDTYPLVSTAYLSNVGEPEAIDQVDGIIVAPLDGLPLTNAQEYRDILYIFKKTRTYSYNDNGDVPSTWQGIVLDQGLGASVHGVAAILDSGGVSIDYLVLVNFSGIYLFNGSFLDPELSYKIETLWSAIVQDDYNLIQILNDPITKWIILTIPNMTLDGVDTEGLLIGDYSEGLDPMKIKWNPWTFDNQTTTIAILDVNRLIIGSREEV